MRPILTTLLLCCFCGSLFSATFTVNTLDNTNDNVCDGVHCSLREAINAANAAAGADDIVFSVAGTIDLSTGMGNLPVITDQVSIVALNITIANAPGNGIDFTGAANNSALSGLTVVGAQGAAGIFVNAVTGVTLTGCSAISNGNPATSQGGGISLLFSAGSSIVNCTVDGNAENGIFMLDSPGISVSNCTVTNNSFHGIIGVGCNAIQITNNGSNNNGTGAPVPATGANSSSGILISGCNSAIIEDNVCNGSPLEAGI
ncbi:MAG: right-handed parallel beta-helix repeat-containing protein, partial [Bacteroidota bacterium]